MVGCESDRSLNPVYALFRKGTIWIQKFNAMVRFYLNTFLVVDYYMIYLVEDYMFRSIIIFNTPLILRMIIICE